MEQQLLGVALGVGSLAAGYFFSKLATWGNKEVEHLKDIPRYYNLSELERDLNNSPSGVQSRVMVEGIVRRQRTGSTVLFSDDAGVDGAAKLIISTELRKTYNEGTGKWEERRDTMTNQCLSIPFQLADRYGNNLTIENIHLSHGFRSVLQMINQKRSSLEQRSVGDYATNITLNDIPIGSRVIEYMLVYGSPLAALGDAMQFGIGKESHIVFYPEEVGKSILSLISEHEMFVHVNRFISVVLTIGGISLLVLTTLLPLIRQRQRERND